MGSGRRGQVVQPHRHSHVLGEYGDAGEQDALDAIAAASEEGDLSRLVDSVLGGDSAGLEAELTRLHSVGVEGISLVRPALLRRLGLLAKLRAEVDQGNSVSAVMASSGKSLFWKDKELFGRLLGLWDAKGLARVAERAGRLERDLLVSPASNREALGEELLSIARAARGRR